MGSFNKVSWKWPRFRKEPTSWRSGRRPGGREGAAGSKRAAGGGRESDAHVCAKSRRGDEPVQQLYRALRADIESGALAAGARLPSKRAFAKHLGVSVVTVEGALDQLVAEGYVRAVPRSGFYVQEIGPNLASFSRVSTRETVKSPSKAGFEGKSALGVAKMGVSGNDDVETLEKLATKDESFCIACGEGDVLGVHLGLRGESGPRGYEAKIRSDGGIEDGRAGCGASWCGQNDVGANGSPTSRGRRRRKGCFPTRRGRGRCGACWPTRASARCWRPSGPQGSPRLRAAIAAHLRGFRGMEVHPDQIVIGSGAQSLYGLLVQLLGRDLAYGVEDPGYPRLARIPTGRTTWRCGRSPSTGKGPVVGGARARPHRRAALHALRTSFPPASRCRCRAGARWWNGPTAPRRSQRAFWRHASSDGPSRPSEAKWDPENALVDECGSGKVGRMLETRSRYLIEDDFDCEFRMAGRPVPPLAALDGAGRVIYANTFSKTLGGAFRIGYVVLPEALAERFRDRAWLSTPARWARSSS